MVVVPSPELLVIARANTIDSNTAHSRPDMLPSARNTSIMMSKNKNQLSLNITSPIDFLSQYARKNCKVPKNLREKEYYNERMENQIDNDTEQTVVRYIPRNATLHALAEFFSACSDVTRAKIICALSISEMCVSDLSRILGINQTTCSHQLRLLRAADIVKQRRDGKIIYYSLKNRKIEDVLLAGVDFLNL